MSYPQLIIEVTGEGREVHLPSSGQLVIGSDPGRSDLTLDDQGIAPVHCTIGRIRGGGWALKDLGSDYGSLVNGRPATTVRLVHGDVIVIGSKHLRVSDPSLPLQPESGANPSSETEPASTPAPPTPATGTPSASAAPDLPGYRLERLLGRGGMGQVWLATQISLDRRVALKVLSAGLEADGAFVERFQAEARAAAALAHPNVVTVHDVSEAGGHHFLTMEYMAGGCLETRLAELGPVPWQEVLSILRDAARGLEYAESKGIVHRDIKPANLMRTEAGIVKIADLGLAGSVEQDEFNGDGKIFGTPHFIAPEVVRGNRADARSDLYSLGATAFRILSGHTPFEGDSSKEILRRVLHDEAADLRDFDPRIPEGVNRLIARMLAKQPERRPPSASILLREIERLLDAEGRTRAPVAARRSARKTLAWLALVLVAGLALGVKSLLGGDGPSADPGPGPSDPNVTQLDPQVPAQLPGDPVDGGPTPLLPDSPGEAGDRNEQLVELEAENALLRLRDRSLSDGERIDELRSIAKRYLGTDAAGRAVQMANLLEAKVAAESEAALEETRRRQSLLDSMQQAARPDPEGVGLTGESPNPGRALGALAAVPGQEEWAEDEIFQNARAALKLKILNDALAWAEERWTAAEQFEAAGDFEQLDDALTHILSVTDLPPFVGLVSEPLLDSARELLALGQLARIKHDLIDILASQFLAQRSQADHLALAQALGVSSGMHTLVRNLDLAGFAERLADLQGGLSNPAGRAGMQPHLQRAEAGQRALQALVDAWDQGHWKRHSILNPNGGRGTLQAAGANAAGLRLVVDGAPQHTPWSAWADNPRAFENLFTGRLNRAWSGPELEDISSALMLVSVSKALGPLQGFLSGDKPFQAPFSRTTGDAIVDSFATALEWAERAAREGGDGTTRGDIVREAAAAEVLIAGLLAGKAGHWAEAVSALEYALGEHGRSLLVLLLSDGTDIWETPSPPPAEEETIEGPDGESD